MVDFTELPLAVPVNYGFLVSASPLWKLFDISRPPQMILGIRYPWQEKVILPLASDPSVGERTWGKMGALVSLATL